VVSRRARPLPGVDEQVGRHPVLAHRAAEESDPGEALRDNDVVVDAVPGNWVIPVRLGVVDVDATRCRVVVEVVPLQPAVGLDALWGLIAVAVDIDDVVEVVGARRVAAGGEFVAEDGDGIPPEAEAPRGAITERGLDEIAARPRRA
jgi:hypothetical protein